MFHCITTCANEFFTLERELEFLPTAFAVILTPVALPILPKVEFNCEVIMYIYYHFVSQLQKAAICNCRQNLLEFESVAIFMFSRRL